MYGMDSAREFRSPSKCSGGSKSFKPRGFCIVVLCCIGLSYHPEMITGNRALFLFLVLFSVSSFSCLSQVSLFCFQFLLSVSSFSFLFLVALFLVAGIRRIASCFGCRKDGNEWPSET